MVTEVTENAVDAKDAVDANRMFRYPRDFDAVNLRPHAAPTMRGVAGVGIVGNETTICQLPTDEVFEWRRVANGTDRLPAGVVVTDVSPQTSVFWPMHLYATATHPDIGPSMVAAFSRDVHYYPRSAVLHVMYRP